MRWIFLCLIFFNLLYFGWEFYMVPDEQGGGNRESFAAENLADEGLQGERLVLLKEVLSTTSQAAPPPSIDRAARGQQLQLPKAASAAEKPELPVPPDVPGDDESGQGRAVEMQPQQLGTGSPEVALSASAADDEEPGLARVCAKVGPYEDQVRAEALLLSLQERGVQPVLRRDEVVLDMDNWVIIPPLGSRSEALRMLRRLQSNKIDSYLISEGEFTNGISLGLFKQASSAQGILAKMASAGYDAEIHQIERTQARFWVGLTGEFEPGSIDQMLTQLVDDSEKINFSETLCEMFASTP